MTSKVSKFSTVYYLECENVYQCYQSLCVSKHPNVHQLMIISHQCHSSQSPKRPVVLDAVGWLACMGMGWPSLLTNQLGCIQHHPLLAPLPPAERSQATQRLTVDWYSCCCHRWYQMTTRWHAHCTITSAICFSIWASQSLNMSAELLMPVTYHQPVPNSAKYRGNV